MDYLTLVILATFFGFLALAALLLVPVYRFLKREEQASAQWTREQLARQAPQANGHGTHPAAEETTPSNP